MCAAEDGDFSGEAVIGIEFEFFDGDGIVFIDHGNDGVSVEEVVEGVSCVGGAEAGVNVVVGEKELGDGDMVGGESGFVSLHEAGLADSGAGLASGEGIGFGVEAEGAESSGDGTGGDDHALETGAYCGGDFCGDTGEAFAVEAFATGLGKDAGAELEDDTPRDAGAFRFHCGGEGCGCGTGHGNSDFRVVLGA